MGRLRQANLQNCRAALDDLQRQAIQGFLEQDKGLGQEHRFPASPFQVETRPWSRCELDWALLPAFVFPHTVFVTY